MISDADMLEFYLLFSDAHWLTYAARCALLLNVVLNIFIIYDGVKQRGNFDCVVLLSNQLNSRKQGIRYEI